MSLVEETNPRCQDEQALAFDAREVITAIAAAPNHYREALVALEIEGLSYKQAARHLGAPVATIASRVSRGCQHVAQALNGSPARGGVRGP